MNRTYLIRVSVEVQGIIGKIRDLLYRYTIERKNVFITLVAIPCCCWNVSRFAQTSASQVVLVLAFITLNLSTMSYYVAFLAFITHTLTTEPFKRFVFGKNFKLRFG